MKQLVFNLAPQIEPHDSQAGHGREVLRKVYFRITVPYYEKAMYDYNEETQEKERESVRAYYDEIVKLLEKNGWHQTSSAWKEGNGTCPQMMKNNSRLYCHPQSISGEIAPDEIEMLSALFKDAKNFKHYKTDDYRDVVVTTSVDDEKALYRETFDDSIMQKIQEATTTKRRNLYKTRSTVEHILQKQVSIETVRIGQFFGDNYTGWGYVAEKINEAITAGLIITADNGRMIRWISKRDK